MAGGFINCDEREVDCNRGTAGSVFLDQVYVFTGPGRFTGHCEFNPQRQVLDFQAEATFPGYPGVTKKYSVQCKQDEIVYRSPHGVARETANGTLIVNQYEL